MMLGQWAISTLSVFFGGRDAIASQKQQDRYAEDQLRAWQQRDASWPHKDARDLLQSKGAK